MTVGNRLSFFVLVGLVGVVLFGFLLQQRSEPAGDVKATEDVPAAAAEQRSAVPATPAPAMAAQMAAQEVGSAQLEGVVRDLLTGEGIGGVSISFRSAGPEVSTTSRTDGSYAISLVPGRYQIHAAGAGVSSLSGGDADASRSDHWVTVVADSHVRDFDIALVRLAKVHGRVVDSNGDPLAGVHLSHRTRLLDRIVDSDDTVPAGETESAAEGLFTVQVPPGEVTLVATAANLPPSCTAIRWVEPGAEIRGIEIVIDRGTEVSGRVVDSAGQPVPRARVVAHGDELREPTSTGSDSSGGFRFPNLPSGEITLEADAAEYAPSPPVVVRVETGTPRRDVTLTVGDAASIRGRVVDVRGAGIDGATVRAVRAMSGLPAPQAIADGSGNFEISRLGPGPFDIHASAENFAPARATDVKAPARGIELALREYSTITGRVTSDGQPLAQFTVRATGRSRAQPTASALPEDFWQSIVRVASINGTYRIEAVIPGSYEVTIASPGRAPLTIPNVVVEPGTTVQVPAELGPGATVSGVVRDATSKEPISGATVQIATGSATSVAYTDTSGEFTIADVAPGRRSLNVQHPAYIGQIKSAVVLAASEQKQADFALEAVPFGSTQKIEFAGIGAALSIEEDRLLVTGLVPHGPAQVAGIQVGDEVFAINGHDARGRSFGDNIEDIRGVAGTVIQLTLRRGDRELFLDVVRATVRVNAEQPVSPEEESDDPKEPVEK